MLLSQTEAFFLLFFPWKARERGHGYQKNFQDLLPKLYANRNPLITRLK
uniref:Uncharacterized protein n=1 Tax=Rhizophora mucronata TaxID=61149 RepID=A0A2P2NGW1_RHIMU